MARSLPGTPRIGVDQSCLAPSSKPPRSARTAGASARTAGPDLIDAPDATLLPGLFDSHVHLTFAAGPDPVAGLIAASDTGLAVRALQHAQLALARGVTTIADCGARGGVAGAVRDAVADGSVTGPR